MSRAVRILLPGLFVFLFCFITVSRFSFIVAQENTDVGSVDFTQIIECLIYGSCNQINSDANIPDAPDEPTPESGTPVPLPTPDPNLDIWQQKIFYACSKLNSIIEEKCNKKVTRTTTVPQKSECYDKLKDDPLLINTDALAEIHHSLYGIKNVNTLQCVGLVRACAALAGTPFTAYLGAAIDYKNIPNDYPYRFLAKGKKGTTPIQIGDMPIWASSKWGHIAVVVAIESDNNFQVVEANIRGNDTDDKFNNGYVTIRSKRLYPESKPNSSSNDIIFDNWANNLVGWLRKK